MADFEALIRNALAKQASVDVQARTRVYNSSRSALRRMIESKPGVSAQAAEARQQALEVSIQKIENEFRASQAAVNLPPASAGGIPDSPQAQPAVPQPAPQVQPQQVFEPVRAEAQNHTSEAAHQPQPQYERSVDPQLDHVPDNSGSDYAATYRAKRNTIRWVGIAGMLVILVLVGWVGYLLVTSLAGGLRVDPNPREARRTSPLNPIGSDDQNYQYIEILEASDPSAIVTNGRGKASIVDEQNQAVVRIISIRSGSDKSKPADPILLELKPGVLQEISGKKVTVEILAKSGSSGPATFSIECALGDYGDCGRKRFRVGIQPEAVVFAIDIQDGSKSDKPAYLAINTDIASTANLTGQGDVLDIVSARLRVLDGS